MNKYIKLFFQRIVKDFKQRELITVKLLFFMHSSTILVLYPYLTIHMRELGINVEETAIMSAMAPVVAILMPPLAGMLADKIGNFRLMLAFFSAAGAAASMLLLTVPLGRVTIFYPEKMEMLLSCSNATPIISAPHMYPCSAFDTSQNTEMQVESCGFLCTAHLEEGRANNVTQTKTYDLQIYDFIKNTSIAYKYDLPDEPLKHKIKSQALNLQHIYNDNRYNSVVRKITDQMYYFPTRSLFNFSCDTTSLQNGTLPCFISDSKQINIKTRLSHRFNASISFSDAIFEEDYFKLNSINNNDVMNDLTCEQNFVKESWVVSISIPIHNDTTTSFLDLGSCTPRCLVTAPREKLCKNTKFMKEYDMSTTFWSYLTIRMLIGIVSGTAFAMFEGAVMAILREHNGDYGLQRIYATIGGMISSPLAGWMIDFASRGKDYTDYRPIFFLYAALKVTSAVLILFIDLKFKKPSQSIVSDVMNVLKKVEIIALFVSCLILGSSWGFIESFLFWLLQDLGGTKSLMGLTITVGGVVGIPLLVLSGPIIKRVGHANVIFVGFVFYAIRLIGYSIIYNPWLCLIFEAMEAFTFGLSFTAAVTYAAELSSMSTDTSIQGILGGLYFGVGKGLGSLTGGYMIKAFGIRPTFQIFSAISMGFGLIYVIFMAVYNKTHPKEKVEKEKKKENMEKNEIVSKEDIHDVPAVYEDALANPGFEDTEFDEKVEPSIEFKPGVTEK